MNTRLSPRQQAGQQREAQACALLQRHGLRHLASNFRCKGGEIDLIMGDGAQIVFVEVRHRASSAFGGAAASVGTAKQRRLVCAAHRYLATLKRVPPCRFDLVAIDGESFTWLKNVIEL
jgi:putative endonuclease